MRAINNGFRRLDYNQGKQGMNIHELVQSKDPPAGTRGSDFIANDQQLGSFARPPCSYTLA